MQSPFVLFRRPRRNRNSDSEDIAQIRLEREGRNEIRRITAAVEKVPWSVSTLQILWTAGPVTLIGAWGGYLLGYGKAPSMENYIFFISYTVITGVAGIIANLVYHLTRGRQYERTADKISHVIDELPELILTTRNLIVESLEGEARRRESAAMLLRKQDLSPEGVELAALELLDDRDSARIIAQIDIYRRVGLQARIQDMIELYRDTIDPQLSELTEVAPEAIALLRDRFAGHAPNLHHGVPRDDNFIERIMAAIEEDNELLMTLQDVEEVLLLAFELISGREIPMLTFEYRGRWQLARTLDALEESRSRYRISQATGLSRLKALTVYLAEQSGTLVEDAAQGLRAEALAQRSREAMDALAEQIHQLAARVRQGETGLRGELRNRANILTNALKLFRSVHEAYEQVGRNHASLLRMSERWDRMTNTESDDATRLQVGPGSRGLRIREKRIELDDAAKAQVCKHLFRHLRDTRLPHRRFEHQTTLPQDHAGDVEAAKRLAIEIALALEPHIQLSRPEVQRAIYASNAAYFGQLEPNLSASAKAALGSAMVKEVNEDLSRSAESLAVALVRHYRVALPPEAIEFLKNTYGARENTLNMVSNYDTRMHRNISLLTHRPPLIGTPARHWYRALVRARRALG